MNTLTKQIIGAAIGGACGHFIAMVIVEIIRLKEQPADSEEFPDWLDGTENNPTDNQGNPIPDEDTLKVKNKTRRTELTTKNYTQHFVSQNRPELAALAAKYNGEEIVDEAEKQAFVESDLIEEATFEIEEDDNSVDPAIITMEEYAGDEELSHVTLKYYEDDILTDEKGNPIDRPEQILGDEALVSFGELSQDEDIVYVRNREKRAMYEVVRMNKNFVAPSPRARTLKDVRQARNSKKEEYDGEDNT